MPGSSGLFLLGQLGIMPGVVGVVICLLSMLLTESEEGLEEAKGQLRLFGAVFFASWIAMVVGHSSPPPFVFGTAMTILAVVFALGLTARVPQMVCGAPPTPTTAISATFMQAASIVGCVVWVGYLIHVAQLP